MPAAYVLHLQTDRPPSPVQLRGWLYHMLTPYEPSLHEGNGPRAFSLASGQEKPKIAWVRIAFLEDDLAQLAQTLFWENLKQALPLGKTRAKLLTVYEEAHPLSGRKSWDELMQAPPTQDVQLRFLTPTLFKKGASHYPVPDPERILQSLIRSWNRFAPERLPEEHALGLLKKITARHISVHTKSLNAHTRTPGFLGWVTLHLPKATDEERRWLARLGELAFFSGVGAKTTLGFGLTEWKRT